MIRLFALLLLILIPYAALASSVVRSGDTVSVAASQAVEGDFYSLGNSVVVSGEVTEDVLALGAALKINGQVGKDVLALSGKVDVDGVVGDDLRVVAGEVVIAGEIKGDLVVVANKLSVLSTAKVSGDVLFFGAEANIAGQVGKSVYGSSNRITLEGVVLGDVDIKTGNLTLSDQADIAGVVKYASSVELVRAQNARVLGKVIKNDGYEAESSNSARSFGVTFLVLLFAALVWFLLFPKLLQKVASQSIEHNTRSIMIGTAFLLVTPFICGTLMLSTLGLLLGVALFFLYFGVIIMSIPVAASVLGAYIAKLIKKEALVTLPNVLLGSVGIFVILVVPIIGVVTLLALFLLTLGSLATHLYRSIKFS